MNSQSFGWGYFFCAKIVKNLFDKYFTYGIISNMKKEKILVYLKYALFFLTLFVVSVGIGLLFLAKQETDVAVKKLEKTYQKTSAPKGDVKAIEKLKPMTILLMGVDTASAQRPDDWEGNSDSMILVTVNPETKKTTMTSLERDLRTDIEGLGPVKLNAAYAGGGADLAISTIQKMLDLKIDYYALINMRGLIDLVDTLGGIEVENNFDFPIAIQGDEPESQVEIAPGKHVINGQQALVYSRMRYEDPDGDYGRQRRQREVIQKILGKLLTFDSINKYNSVLDVVSKNVKTNIKLSDTAVLNDLLKYKESAKNITSYQLAGEGDMIDGVSYQIASKQDILETQNRIRKELGQKEVEESNLKTNLLLGGTVISPYSRESFSNNRERTMADVVNGQ